MDNAYNNASASFVDRFSLGEPLGKGAFSVVYRAFSKKDGKIHAVKVLDKHKIGMDIRSQRRLECELLIPQKVDHPHIVKLYEVIDTNHKIYMIMELVEGGELIDKIIQKGFYTEKDAMIVIQHLIDAVKYLHDHNIAHRDLKPENLLLKKGDDTHIMLSDFGLSRILGEESMASTACGTPYYVAPEVLQAKGYNKEVDMWSIGVITYFLLSGYPPFMGENIKEIVGQICQCKYDFPSPYWDQISTEAKDFISRLLVLDTSKRMTAEEALYHPWLRKSPVEMPKVPLKFNIFNFKNFLGKK